MPGNKPALTPLEIELGEAIEIAAEFCGHHTADQCSDHIAIPINEALAHYREAKGEK